MKYIVGTVEKWMEMNVSGTAETQVTDYLHTVTHLRRA